MNDPEIRELLQLEDDKPPEEEKEEEVDPFGTEPFFIEDSEFYEELEKKIKPKNNIGKFNFSTAKIDPSRIKIRVRTADGELVGDRKKGKVKVKKGDFFLRDSTGKRLNVSSKVFKEVYSKIIG